MTTALTVSDQDLIDQWVIFIHEVGRVPTQIPATVDPAHAGELGSRLQTPNTALGEGPAQWDYELAPPPLVELWAEQGGAVDDAGFLTAVGSAVLDASNAYATAGGGVVTFLQDFPQLAGQAVGSVVHAAGAGVWAAARAALGFSPWWIVAGVAGVAGLVLFTERGNRTARTAAHRAGQVARAAAVL